MQYSGVCLYAGYGCAGVSSVAYGLMAREVERSFSWWTVGMSLGTVPVLFCVCFVELTAAIGLQ